MKNFKNRWAVLIKSIVILSIMYLSLLSNNQDVIANNNINSSPKISLDIKTVNKKNFNIKPYRDLNATKITTFSKNLNNILQRLAYYESEGDWKITNSFGFMGKYQLGYHAMKALGLPITHGGFITNPYIFPSIVQDSAVASVMYLNYKTIKPFMDQSNGKIINGIKMSYTNMIIGCNHVGVGSFKNYLLSNGQVIPRDGNGSTVEFYLQEFENYTVDLCELEMIYNQFKKL